MARLGYLKFKGASTSQVISARNEWLGMIMMAKWYSGTWGPKASWHLSYRCGKTPKKPHPGNLSRPGIEPGPAVWQARMLPPDPQRWTVEWHGQDYLHLKWHVVFPGLATPDLDHLQMIMCEVCSSPRKDLNMYWNYLQPNKLVP